MVKHIILWSFQQGKNTLENKNRIKNSLEELKKVIPGIVDIKVNINPIEGSNCDIMLDSTFENKEALNKYQVNPEHVKAAEFIKSVLCNRMCFDYEI